MSEKFSRKKFLEAGATLAAGMGFASDGVFESDQRAMAVEDGHAELVVLNAKVTTVDDAQPRAEAFAVKNERFIAVGSSSDIKNLVGPGTKVIDATGMAVTPGYNDAHIHAGGLDEVNGVSLLDTPTIGDVIRKLAAKAKQTPPGYVVAGYGYDDTKITDEKTGKFRRITRLDLDQASTERPIIVRHRGGHLSWYNSVSFKNAGITAETSDPPGGRIYREGGQLDGLVAERANALFSNAGKSDPVTRDVAARAVALMSKRMSASGLTNISNPGGGPLIHTAYQDAIARGELCFRVKMGVGGAGYEALKKAGIYSGFGSNMLKVQCAKWSADGSASGRSMAMNTPYVGKPNDYGILTMTQEQLNEACEDAQRNGWQIEIHANGDKAIDMVLNAYERAMKRFPRPDPRHRIEHCTLLNPTLLQRLKQLGVVPELFSAYVHYHGEKFAEYGEEKMKWMFCHRSCLDYGIPACQGSDYLPGPFEPLMGIQSCVTRKDMQGHVWGANQRISVDEAIRVYTINGAHAFFEEKILGSITAGKLADFVIFEKDPHDVDPDTIKHIRVMRTVVGGRTVHEA